MSNKTKTSENWTYFGNANLPVVPSPHQFDKYVYAVQGQGVSKFEHDPLFDYVEEVMAEKGIGLLRVFGYWERGEAYLDFVKMTARVYGICSYVIVSEFPDAEDLEILKSLGMHRFEG